MGTNGKFILLVLIILTLLGCEERVKNKEKEIVLKEYGKWEGDNDTLSIELNITTFRSFNELAKRTEEIVCNDSTPKIILRGEEEIKVVYLRNPCWGHYGCILIREKNTFRIHNDSIIKADVSYPLDSLISILKKDIENNGRNPRYSDSPEKLLITISYDTAGIRRFPNTLHLLTESYEAITNNTNLNIWLNERRAAPPPLTNDSIQAE